MLTIMPMARTKVNYNCINCSNIFTLFLFLAITRKLFSLKSKQSRILQSKHIVPSLTAMSVHSLMQLSFWKIQTYSVKSSLESKTTEMQI